MGEHDIKPDLNGHQLRLFRKALLEDVRALEELLESRIKRDTQHAVSLVREAIVGGHDKVEEMETSKPSRPHVITALKKQLPGMDFKWVNNEHYEDSVDLSWTPAARGPTAPPF